MTEPAIVLGPNQYGKAEVRVDAPPGETRPVTRYLLATTARPINGEVVRCRAA